VLTLLFTTKHSKNNGFYKAGFTVMLIMLMQEKDPVRFDVRNM
jgi:hypothetical protein